MIRPIEVLGPSGGGFVVSSDEDGSSHDALVATID
jgi:hypothetical protein